MFHNIAHPYTAYRKTARASCKKHLLSKVSGASIIPTLARGGTNGGQSVDFRNCSALPEADCMGGSQLQLVLLLEIGIIAMGAGLDHQFETWINFV